MYLFQLVQQGNISIFFSWSSKIAKTIKLKLIYKNIKYYI